MSTDFDSRVGFIGLGKLGLPCAAALSVKAGLKVTGYDINPRVKDFIDQKSVPYQESNISEFLQKADLEFHGSLTEFLEATDIVFIAVQTPH